MGGKTTDRKEIDDIKETLNELGKAVALVQKDITYMKDQADNGDAKSDAILRKIDGLNFVPATQYSADQKEVDKRLSKLEQFVEDNKPGITFINSVVTNLLKILALAFAALILGAAAYNVFKGGL